MAVFQRRGVLDTINIVLILHSNSGNAWTTNTVSDIMPHGLFNCFQPLCKPVVLTANNLRH